MALVLAVGALLLGLARGGSLDALAATTLRWTWLVVAGLAVQLAALLWSPPWLVGARALLVLILSNLAILVFIAGNRRMPGLLVADVGLALNLLVIVANGAMPVSLEAARAAGISSSPANAGIKHEPLDRDTALPWLADVIPVPGGREVLSAGDLLLAAGIARLVYARTTTRPQEERRPKASPASG